MDAHTAGTDRRGFSLLEVLVAVGVMGVCLVPVVSFSQRGLAEASVTAEEILAHQLLMDLCERYKVMDPGRIAQVVSQPSLIESDPLLIPLKRWESDRTAAGSGTMSAGLRFTRSVDLEQNVDGVYGLHRVTFKVTWSAGRSQAHSVSLTRLIHWHGGSR